MSRNHVSALNQIIRERKTAKILRDPAACADLPNELAATIRQTLQDLIESAGWTPSRKINSFAVNVRSRLLFVT